MKTASPPSRRPPWPKMLLVVGVIYAGWLVWLAYVAWVNTQAGNP